MNNLLFPTTVIEDFYPDPDKIREFAYSLEYYPTSGRYPGRKTDGFAVLDKDFDYYTCKKFISVYYDYLNSVDWEIRSEFRIIEPMHPDKNHPINNGLIHQDDNCVLAGICYLNPDPDPDSGTSFYIPKINMDDEQIQEHSIESDVRFDAYTSYGVNYDEELFKLNFKKNRDKFEEILTIKNRYNRLIAFDANHWHGSNTIVCNNQSRLIQLFFVKTLNSKSKPAYMRIREIG